MKLFIHFSLLAACPVLMSAQLWAQTGSSAQGRGLMAPSRPNGAIAHGATFAGEPASNETRRMADWVVASGDNLELPFVVIDKLNAKVFAFNSHGILQGSARALVGLGLGDVSPPGVGQRRLADIPPAERITPAGRFLASLGNDLGKADILWVDYDAGISLHRVVTGGPTDHRRQRLSTTSTIDKRITYGCINVPAKFFDGVIRPAFHQSNGIVYILPEMLSLSQVFPLLR